MSNETGGTPPENDSITFRKWMEKEASKLGYSEMEWKESTDHGKPMGRLYGVRKAVK